MNDWWIFQGTGVPHDGIDLLPEPPSWRYFKVADQELVQSSRKQDLTLQTEQHLGVEARGAKFLADEEEKDLINTALFLREASLLVTGKPGAEIFSRLRCRL